MFLEQFIQHIGPNAKDQFDPDLFDKEKMKFVEPRDRNFTDLCNHELAQLDFLIILIRSGCR